MGEMWFAPGDPSLPTPWKGVIDGNTGCLYYWNPETNITQYEKPVYWVSSPSLSSSCSPGYFYPPPSTASNYDHHSQYPNLYPHHQTPTETVINGYTFPTQFPFPNHTQTPTNQPIYPQSQSMVEPIYTEFSSFYPASNIDPLVPTFQSPCDLNPSIPTFVPQVQFLDPNLLSSSLSPAKYEPQPIPLGPNAAPALAVQTTDLDHSTPSKFPDPSFDFEEMAAPQLTCFHLEQTAELQEVSETAAQTPTIPRCGFENAREAYHTTILRDEYSSKTSFPVELVQTVALRIAHSTSDAEKYACNRRPMEKLWDDNGELRPMGFVFKATPIFFLINMKKPLLSVGVMYGQMMGSAELYPIGRATDLLLLADSRRILDKSGGPLVHWELRSMVTEVARLYLNCSLEKTMTSLGNMPGETEPSAPVNHFWNLVVDVDNFSLVTTLICGLKPILLSMSFVESPVILEVYLPESYYQGIKHEVVAFDKFLVCSFHFIKLIETLRVAHLLATLPNWKARETNALASSKGGSQYELRLESSIESFTRNSQRFFINMHGRGIEVQCSVMYHWLPYSLNWDQRSICDAFLSHKFSMSCATVKFLLSAFCQSGSKFQNKAIVEASLENIGLKVVICAHWKVMDYALHLVGALSIETVGHTISTALVYDQNFCGALLVLELHLGLLIVVVLSFAAIEQLLTIGINSDGLVIALMSDSCNKKLSVCSLITNATNRKIWGQFISLEKCKLDGQLNFLVHCIFQIEYPLMDKSCILHSSGKHLDQSHFLVQLQKNSGIIYFAIHEQLKQTYRVNCFISLVEVYLVNYLLFFEDKMFEHWSNKSSKFGECRVHELSQHRDKMKIFPKLDDTSSKLVVIKSVKVVLTQAVIFYYYVVWLISLVILHFGCGPYFFLCECVGHFRTDAENLTIINGGATDDNMLSCALATSTLGHLKRSGLLEFFVGHLQAEPTLLRVTSAVFSVAAIKLGHHNSSLEQADDLLKVNYIVMPFRYCSDAQLTMANSTVLLDVVLHFPAHELYYIAPSMINLFEATFTHNWGYWLNWQIMPHAPWDLTIMIIASFIVRRRVVQALYWHLYAGGAWLQHSLPFGSPFYKIANLLAFVIIFGGIHAANSLGILQTGQEVYNVHSYRKEVNTHRLLILTSNVVVMKKAAGCAICIPNQQTAQVLLFFNPSIPTCKVLVPTFVMEKWRVEETGMLNEVTERRMVSVERLWAHFPISTCLRPEDMPLFKGGGMLGLLCYNYLLTWVNVLGYLNGLYIGLYNYMGNCIRIGSSCKRVSRVG